MCIYVCLSVCGRCNGVWLAALSTKRKNAQKEEEKQGQVKVVTHLQGWSNSFNRCVYLFLLCVFGLERRSK